MRQFASFAMSFRGQLQGFFFGFAVAGGIAMYQLQKDMWSSHRLIIASVRALDCGVRELIQEQQSVLLVVLRAHLHQLEQPG